jgi:hypothetical protein
MLYNERHEAGVSDRPLSDRSGLLAFDAYQSCFPAIVDRQNHSASRLQLRQKRHRDGVRRRRHKDRRIRRRLRESKHVG